MTNNTQSLQIKDSGSWRNVVKTTKEQMIKLAPHITAMSVILGGKLTWRIVEGTDVIGYLYGPDYEDWKPPHWKA